MSGTTNGQEYLGKKLQHLPEGWAAGVVNAENLLREPKATRGPLAPTSCLYSTACNSNGRSFGMNPFQRVNQVPQTFQQRQEKVREENENVRRLQDDIQRMQREGKQPLEGRVEALLLAKYFLEKAERKVSSLKHTTKNWAGRSITNCAQTKPLYL